MHLGPKYARSWAHALILFFGSLSAHLLGGGGLVNFNNLAFDSSLIIVLLVRINLSEASPYKVATLIVIAQSAGHFVLGGMTSGNLLMAISHLVSGFISYLAITRSEEIWRHVAATTNRLLLRKFDFQIHLKKFATIQIGKRILLESLELISKSHQRRGPPISFSPAGA